MKTQRFRIRITRARLEDLVDEQLREIVHLLWHGEDDEAFGMLRSTQWLASLLEFETVNLDGRWAREWKWDSLRDWTNDARQSVYEFHHQGRAS